ncbi:MAG: DNA polymerase III subunit beta [Fusobacteriaceae bacterium]|nr:DNA polymerase III subunit beta [Fusobacteriaceae bacterium]
MILKINRENFLNGIKTVEKAIVENKVKPIISCVYMDAGKNELLFCGTNLETTIITMIPCDDIIEGGRIVFQHHMVAEYLNELNDVDITLSINEDNNLLIENEDSSSEFALMNADDYPALPVDINFDEKVENFSTSARTLADVLEKVKFSASVSPENVSINCVRMESEGNTIKFISTDTFRLTYLESEMDKINEPINLSIPFSTVDSLVKLFRNNEDLEVKFYWMDGKIFFKLGYTLTISRVVDMTFPNYRAILESGKYDKKLTIKNSEFSKILKRVSIFVRNSQEAKYGATITFSGSSMVIEGANDIAKISESAEVNFIGDPIKIALNAKFILDFVQNLDKEDNISMELVSSANSVKITSGFESHKNRQIIGSSENDKEIENNEEKETEKKEVTPYFTEKKYIYIVMPLSLKNK